MRLSIALSLLGLLCGFLPVNAVHAKEANQKSTIWFEEMTSAIKDVMAHSISPAATFVSDEKRSFYGVIVEIGFLKDSDKAALKADFSADQQGFISEYGYKIQSIEELKTVHNSSAEQLRARTLLVDGDSTLVLNEDYVFSKHNQKRYALFLVSKVADENAALKAKESIWSEFSKQNSATSARFQFIQSVDFSFFPAAHAQHLIRDPLRRSEVGSGNAGRSQPAAANPPAPECMNIGIISQQDIRRSGERFFQHTPKQLADGCSEGSTSVITAMARGTMPAQDVRWYRQLGFTDAGVESAMLNVPFALGVIGMANAADRSLQGLSNAKKRLVNWFSANQGNLIRAIGLEFNNGVDRFQCLTATKRLEILCEVATIVAAAAAPSAKAAGSANAVGTKVRSLAKDVVETERTRRTEARSQRVSEAQQAAGARRDRQFFPGYHKVQDALANFKGSPVSVRIRVPSQPENYAKKGVISARASASRRVYFTDKLVDIEQNPLLRKLQESGATVDGMGVPPQNGFGERTITVTNPNQARDLLKLIEDEGRTSYSVETVHGWRDYSQQPRIQEALIVGE